MQEPLRVGIAGLGTVGSAVAQILERRANALAQATGRAIQIAGVSARRRSIPRPINIAKYRWFDDPVALARHEGIDVFVEAIGGESGPARDAVEAAIESRKSVVTANKALLARQGMRLAKNAERLGVSLNFEAVVAGGVPIIKQLREALVGNSIEKIYGILNGTCNYVLTQMRDNGLSFEQALADAKAKGYAEADARTDIDGIDTAHKLAVLATLAFGIELRPDSVHREGISDIGLDDLQEARELGYEIKLLGIAERWEGKILMRVHPALVPREAPLSAVSGVLNAVAIRADAVDLTSIGPGAGGEATASAVVADVADIARGNGLRQTFLRSVEQLEKFDPLPIDRHYGSFFIRLKVEDRKGVFASIAKHMSDESISLESIKQISDRRRGFQEPGVKPIALVTHETSEFHVNRALSAVRAEGFLRDAPKLIRIEG
jgi:homoserine dehydrogenase